MELRMEVEETEQGSNEKPSFSSGQRVRIGLSVIVSMICVLLIVGIVNFIGQGHFKRFHLSRDYPLALSPYSQQLARSLTNNLHVTVYFNPYETATTEAHFKYVTSLLKEYQYENPRITVDVINYIEDPGKARFCELKYGLTELNAGNLVIFEYGGTETSVGRVDFVNEQELSDYEAAGFNEAGIDFRRTGFKGEQLFTSAILSLSELTSQKAYFVQGHQEHKITNTEYDDHGYDKLSLLLQQNNITVTNIYLNSLEKVPDDCSLLVLGGPKSKFPEQEILSVQKYLERGGGRVLALIRPGYETGLGELMSSWGVSLGEPNQVVGENNKNNQYGGEFTFGVTNFVPHPVTRPLAGSQLHMILPGEVAPQSQPEEVGVGLPEVQSLFLTSNGGFEGFLNANNSVMLDYAQTPRQISLAVAVEKGAIPGVSANQLATRMIVVGESQFLDNQAIDSLANRNFAHLAVNWLLDRSTLVDIGPKPVQNYKLEITDADKRTTYWIMLAGFPGGVFILGTLVWLTRRK